MKKIIVNIKEQTVTENGETCNFYEAGLTDNADPVKNLTSKEEIEEVIREREVEEVKIIFK